MRKLVFGSKSHRSLPFEIAGATFFARPLTTREELPLADVADRYDLDTTGSIQAFFQEQSEMVARMLQDRVQGELTPPITPAWVMEHLSSDTLTTLMTFLRTGERPKDPLQLTAWTDEALTINDREFTTRRLNFREQQAAADFPEDEGARATTERAAHILADLLTARAVDGAPVTADWLIDTLTTRELAELTTLLAKGPEVTDPNADVAAGPEAAAGASSTSAD